MDKQITELKLDEIENVVGGSVNAATLNVLPVSTTIKKPTVATLKASSTLSSSAALLI